MEAIGTLIKQLRGADLAYNQFIADARQIETQFQNRNGEPLIGAQLLPEEFKDNNEYREEDLQLLDMVADSLDAYSPPDVKTGAARYKSFMVELGDSGIATQMSPKEYSDLLKQLRGNPSMEAAADGVMDFNGQLTRAMTTYNEKHRWDAILNASVTRTVGGTAEPIAYPNGTSSGGFAQRQTLSAAWSNNAYDPFDDLKAVLVAMRDFGYTRIVRTISTLNVATILMNNQNVARRTSNFTQVLDATPGAATTFFDPPSRQKLDDKMREYEIPPIETYDVQYSDQAGSHRFIPNDVMVFVFGTDRLNEPATQLSIEMNEPFLPDTAMNNTIGYTGIGTTAGHEDAGPGRWQNVEFYDGSRPYVFGEGVQKSLPVITEPYGFVVFKGIH